MKKQVKALALMIVVGGCLACPLPAQSAEQSGLDSGKRAREESLQLLKDRDEARPKAKVAEQKMLDAGARPESLGFESARTARDKQAASGAKGAAYERYVKTAKQLEKKIKDEVERGVKAVVCLDIARFECLQAEVDLARIAGRLPAAEEK